jgi:hypothetical protein
VYSRYFLVLEHAPYQILDISIGADGEFSSPATVLSRIQVFLEFIRQGLVLAGGIRDQAIPNLYRKRIIQNTIFG